MVDMIDLFQQLNAAGGGDARLDRAVADFFSQPLAEYSESTDQSRALVGRVLPGWHLHLGFGASGVLPYAALSSGDIHCEAEAATVPLAILRCLMQAFQAFSLPAVQGQTKPPPA